MVEEIIMKPKTKFQKAIKKDKDKLVDLGYSESTLRSWMYGYRRPAFENAGLLTSILHLNIRDIPYRQVIVND